MSFPVHVRLLRFFASRGKVFVRVRSNRAQLSSAVATSAVPLGDTATHIPDAGWPWKFEWSSAFLVRKSEGTERHEKRKFASESSIRRPNAPLICERTVEPPDRHSGKRPHDKAGGVTTIWERIPDCCCEPPDEVLTIVFLQISNFSSASTAWPSDRRIESLRP